jgi:hypothetical protein
VHPAFPRPFEGETLKIKPRAKNSRGEIAKPWMFEAVAAQN